MEELSEEAAKLSIEEKEPDEKSALLVVVGANAFIELRPRKHQKVGWRAQLCGLERRDKTIRYRVGT